MKFSEMPYERPDLTAAFAQFDAMAQAIAAAPGAADVLAQYAARRLKMIATVFGTLAIIAFVPGLGLYRCMSLLAQGNTSLGLQTGIVAMSNIVMITFGLGVGSFLMRMFFAARAERKHHGG